MLPKIVHYTAKSGLRWEERVLMRHNKKLLPDYEFVFHDDRDNEAICLRDFPQFYDSYRRIPKGVAKSDLARVMYMYRGGGCYIDTDYKFVRRPETSPCWGQKPIIIPLERGNGETARLGNAILFSEPDQGFWLDFLTRVFSNPELFSLKEERIIDVTGPGALTRFYHENIARYEGMIALPPKEQFYPVYRWGRLAPANIGFHLNWGSWVSKSGMGTVRNFLKRKVSAWL